MSVNCKLPLSLTIEDIIEINLRFVGLFKVDMNPTLRCYFPDLSVITEDRFH